MPTNSRGTSATLPGPIRLFLPSPALVAIALCCGGGLVNGDALAIDFSAELVTETRSATSNDGATTLTWELPRHSKAVELQQDSTDRFTDPVLRYHGADTGSVLTGLPEGAHFFRIRALDADGQGGPWSAPFQVHVSYMERGRLFLFLVTGGVVVALTAGAIMGGHLKTRKKA